MRYWRHCCWRRSSWFWIGSKLRGELAIFVLAGAALIPLSWLIGEAMDNLARHMVAYAVLVVAFYLSGDR